MQNIWKLFLLVCFWMFAMPVNAQVASDGGLADQELKKEIGQMIMLGFRGTEATDTSEISQIIKDVSIGGVVLFDYDTSSKSFPRNIINYQQTKKLISSIQAYSETPLFVAVDAEGGSINRLNPRYGFLPIVSAKRMGQDKTLQTTHRESTELAGELKSMGFNMNLAPVVDLDVNPKNPIIGALGRSFSAQAKEVIEHARIFIENHFKKDIITVEKHFPGHGSALKDSHQGLTDVTNTYKDEELAPYQKLNEEGLLKMVMVAHLINKNIDKSYPASLSKYFLQDILRGQIGFNGLIISDDMGMAAISDNYKLEEAVVLAVNAGVDVISILNTSFGEYDSQAAYKVRDIIFNAVKAGKIKEERIRESYNRIISLKKEFRIIRSAEDIENLAAEIKKRDFELIGQAGALTFGEALSLAKWVGEYVSIRPAFLMAIFQEELKLEKFDLCYLTNFNTGEGVRLGDGKKLSRVMKPSRDIQKFLDISKDLGRDPSKTLVTCPMSFGWGGAMGPADFIPSTWFRYKGRVEKITGQKADPWNIRDAFLAAGLYLSDSGANLKTQKGEWNSAMIYFSGSTSSPYTWYGDGSMMIADEIQSDIDLINRVIN